MIMLIHLSKYKCNCKQSFYIAAFLLYYPKLGRRGAGAAARAHVGHGGRRGRRGGIGGAAWPRGTPRGANGRWTGGARRLQAAATTGIYARGRHGSPRGHVPGPREAGGGREENHVDRPHRLAHNKRSRGRAACGSRREKRADLV